MNILLTGATGFVGRNYLLRTLARGGSVIAPVRDSAKLAAQLRAEGVDMTRVEAWPADPSLWPRVEGIDAAVLSAGALFARDLDSYLATNVEWTLSVLAALPADVPTVVLSSQSAGGPTPEDLLSRDEWLPDDPRSHYGESKLRMERTIRREFPGAPIALLRPPMILGPRDTAALQLFKMARSPLRVKPGLKPKTYSFIACDDLLEAIDAAIPACADLTDRPLYVASRQSFTDIQLLDAVASSMGRKGFNLPLPEPIVRTVSAVVDAVPSLRSQLPSLTRDRVREIWPHRWVVNPGAFESATGWFAKFTLEEALASALASYRDGGWI